MNRIATFAFVGVLVLLPIQPAAAQETKEARPGTDTMVAPTTSVEATEPDVASGEIDSGPADGYAVGPTDAAVTIEEYTDYLCGYCREFEVRVSRPLREKYAGPGGSVRWVTRIHPNVAGSWNGAVAAWCAARQSRFWEVHDLLFERVGDWSEARRAGVVFLEIARERGLDAERYEACLADPRSRSDVVAASFDRGRRYVWGTPVLFLNGVAVPRTEKYYSFEGLEAVIHGETPIPDGPAELSSCDPDPIPCEHPEGSEPAVLNSEDIEKAMWRYYPKDLREAGMGGSVTLWLFVDPSGTVGDIQIAQTSGYDALDVAAARVAREMRFEPARYAGEPVGVWAAQLFDFEVSD